MHELCSDAAAFCDFKFNNILSSIKVGAHTTVTLYDDNHFKGKTLTLSADVVCLQSKGWDDIASSAKVTDTSALCPGASCEPKPTPVPAPLPVNPLPKPTQVDLLRYFNPDLKDRLYTLDEKEIGTTTYGTKGKSGYIYEGVACKCLSASDPNGGTVPLYKYWSSAVNDHFYTTNAAEVGTTKLGELGLNGYTSEGIACWVYTTRGEGEGSRIPLYRYLNPNHKHHFYTTSKDEVGVTTIGTVGKDGFVSEGVVGWVFPALATQEAKSLPVIPIQTPPAPAPVPTPPAPVPNPTPPAPAPTPPAPAPVPTPPAPVPAPVPTPPAPAPVPTPPAPAPVPTPPSPAPVPTPPAPAPVPTPPAPVPAPKPTPVPVPAPLAPVPAPSPPAPVPAPIPVPVPAPIPLEPLVKGCIRVYENEDYKGKWLRICGDFIKNFQEWNFNGVISSIELGPYTKATLYEKVDFLGTFLDVNQNSNNLTNEGFNNKASSVRISTYMPLQEPQRIDPDAIKKGCIVAFEHIDFGGKKLEICAEIANLNTWSNIISSAKLGKWTGATFFGDINFKGEYLTINNSINDFRQYGFNDKASSVKLFDLTTDTATALQNTVLPTGCIIVYEDINYQGFSAQLCGNVSNLLDIKLSNKISSARVGSLTSVAFFEFKEFQGRRFDISKDIDNFVNYHFNDVAESLRIWKTETPVRPTLGPLYRYKNSKLNNHFYTLNWQEIGVNVVGKEGKDGYVFEGIVGWALPNRDSQGLTVPLYRYYQPKVNDYFFTTNGAEVGTTTQGETGKFGYISEGIACYVYRGKVQFDTLITQPLYRYFEEKLSDHLYTRDATEVGTTTLGELGKNNYRSEGIVGWIFATDFAAPLPVPTVPTILGKSPKSGCAWIFEHINYEGQQLEVCGLNAKLDAFWENRISSIIIGADTRVWIYSLSDYKGRAIALTQSQKDFRTFDFNDKTLSLKVEIYTQPLKMPQVLSFYRYVNAVTTNHLYTTDILEVGTSQAGERGKNGFLSEGIAALCIASQDPWNKSVPLYRYFNAKLNDYFFTTNAAEVGTTTFGQEGKSGYVSQGIACYVFKQQSDFPELFPLYRYFNDKKSDHIYTTDATEFGTTKLGEVGLNNYRSEGIVGWVWKFNKIVPTIPPMQERPDKGCVWFYTLANFLGTKMTACTADPNKKISILDLGDKNVINSLIVGTKTIVELYASINYTGQVYRYETDQATLPVVFGNKTSSLSLTKVTAQKADLYRYYQPKTFDHFYTLNSDEVGTKEAGKEGKNGYLSEGLAASCLTIQDDLELTVPLYRYWQPHTQDHFYTTNASEVGTTILGNTGKDGYISEGIACWVYRNQKDVADLFPLYRYYNTATNDHLYTMDAAEIGTTTLGVAGNYGYVSEGIVGWLFKALTAAKPTPIANATTIGAPLQGCAWIFELDNYLGKVLKICENYPDLSKVPGWNDIINSVRVGPKTYIQVWVDANYLGKFLKATVDVPSFKVYGFENSVSSFQVGVVQVQLKTTELYRYVNRKLNDHFYTIDSKEIGTITPGQAGTNGYVSEGVASIVLSERDPDQKAVPLFRYYQPLLNDNFYTTNSNEVGTITKGQVGLGGYRSEGIACWVLTKRSDFADLGPFFRYFNAETNDHLYTMDADEVGTTRLGEEGNNGYKSEGVVAWTWPPKVKPTPIPPVAVLPNEGCVWLYEHIEYVGKRLEVCKNIDDLSLLPGGWNDLFSSLKTGPKTVVTLWENALYKGLYLKATSVSIPDFRVYNYNDLTSSVQVSVISDSPKSGCAWFFDGINFAGKKAEACVDVADLKLVQGWFAIASIKLGPETWIKLWQEANYKGKFMTITKVDVPEMKKYNYVDFITSFNIGVIKTDPNSSATPFYKYYNADTQDSFYTVNKNVIGTTVPGQLGKYGYTSQGIAAIVLTKNEDGSVPLYRYWQSVFHDHFYTTNPREVGTTIDGELGNYGYRSEGIACYVYPTQASATNLVPFYRYYNSVVGNHFYTVNASDIGTTKLGEVGKDGYRSEGIVGWVFAPVG